MATLKTTNALPDGSRAPAAAAAASKHLRRCLDHAQLLEPGDLGLGEPEYLAGEPVVVLAEPRRVRAREAAAVVWQPLTVALVPPRP